MSIELIRVSSSNPYYKSIRKEHYVEYRGTIGRQIHYLIEKDFKVIGIISGASAVWATEGRDKFFNITKENRVEMINRIINNVVFRLNLHEKNLASHILSIWRRQILDDWEDKYGVRAIGFETFVYGARRNGVVYKADNWTFCGYTKGSTKQHPHGAYKPHIRVTTERKMIFCRYA